MRIQLSGGAYEARGVIASAQRSLNLYAEPLPQIQGEAAQWAYYPRPGLRTLVTLPKGPVRGVRQVTTGGVYAVGGDTVYLLANDWTPTALGTITGGKKTPVSMADNGLDLAIVDGSANGWKVTLASNTLAQIVDPTGSFRGANRVDFVDTYFTFNVPGTPQFQISKSMSLDFDPLYFANKEGFSDLLVSAAVVRRQLWLIGSRTTEPWYNTGAADFPFAALQGGFIDQGCAAVYSVANIDNSVLWLTQDRAGQGMVVRASGSEAKRVSTFALEAEIAGYSAIDDAYAWTWQIGGHAHYVLTFPHANRTWDLDTTTGQWAEACWMDANGVERPHRVMCSYQCRGLVVGGDRENGNLYALDPAALTDAGMPIKRVRSYPHITNNGRRVLYRQFIADIQAGEGMESVTPPVASLGNDNDLVFLSWSDDRGRSFGNPIGQSFAELGEFRTSVQFQRLGMARDRVFKLEWSTPTSTALLGAWIEAVPANS